MTDGSPLGKEEHCVWSRLTIRTLRVSPRKCFLAEQDLSSSGSLGASGAEFARDLEGPESLLLDVAAPTASSSSIFYKLEYGFWSHKAWGSNPSSAP